MATEDILMLLVKKGGDRQKLHEKIRVHSMEAACNIKVNGGDNDLIDRLVADDSLDLTREEIAQALKPDTGRAALQTEEFIRDYCDPLLDSVTENAATDSILI